jgi:NAD+ synthase (glutamine-hydrolysing)
VKIALAQLNPTIGDISGNTEQILLAVRQAATGGADLVVFPEQAVIGYPGKDLLLRREIVEQNVAAVQRIAAESRAIPILLGYAEPNREPAGRPLWNAAALLSTGGIVARWRKRLLPTYDVFDEARYFEPAPMPQPVVAVAGRRLGVTICEDLLSQELYGRRLYACDPAADLVAAGAELVINLSASPFELDKHAWRVQRLRETAERLNVPVAFVNQVGGNDELLFDGASLAVAADGTVLAQARAFAQELLLVDLERGEENRREALPEGPALLHDALVMGLRDYARKCGFRTAVVGLSGGVDSSVVAALAAEALSSGNVHGVSMPSRFSSNHSVSDARELATNLGIRFSLIPIEPVHVACERTLEPHFAGRPVDVTEENVQARIRGLILMALSNKFGSLLLTTGNKSELAVGYCTLYGDMAGGLAVVSDVPKTMLYALAREINERAGRPLIPPGCLTKPPSAELRPNQTDQDTLPPYEVLDAILERFEEQLQDADQIVAAGFDRATVEHVIRMIRASEYKRQQAAPGLKVTSRAFGFGRRMPIAARPPWA